MKLHGKKITERNVETVVFPRPDGPLVFKLAAIVDDSEFDKLVIAPKPGFIQKKGQDKPTPNFEDEKYKAELAEYWQKRSSWFMLASISATPGLEWETVNLTDPTTWKNWAIELKDAGLSIAEIDRLCAAQLSANSLDEKKLEEARASFLLSQVQPGQKA